MNIEDNKATKALIQIENDFRGNEFVNVTKAETAQEDIFRVQYNLDGIYLTSEDIVDKMVYHQLEVTIPKDYPNTEPKLKMLTPIFHPNIENGVISLTGIWDKNQSLSELIITIGKMIQYQLYDLENVASEKALKWLNENKIFLPIGKTEITINSKNKKSSTNYDQALSELKAMAGDSTTSKNNVTASINIGHELNHNYLLSVIGLAFLSVVLIYILRLPSQFFIDTIRTFEDWVFSFTHSLIILGFISPLFRMVYGMPIVVILSLIFGYRNMFVINKKAKTVKDILSLLLISVLSAFVIIFILNFLDFLIINYTPITGPTRYGIYAFIYFALTDSAIGMAVGVTLAAIKSGKKDLIKGFVGGAVGGFIGSILRSIFFEFPILNSLANITIFGNLTLGYIIGTMIFSVSIILAIDVVLNYNKPKKLV